MTRSNSNNHDASRNPSSDKPSLRDRMSQDLQLRGLADRTQTGYLREVTKLAAYYHIRPDQLSEQQVGDLDSQRMMVHVHRGKGAKDRYLPLPKSTLTVLRQYWVTHRHPTLRRTFSKPVSRCVGFKSFSATAVCKRRSSIST